MQGGCESDQCAFAIPMRILTGPSMVSTLAWRIEWGLEMQAGTMRSEDMLAPHPDDVGGHVICMNCAHTGQYLKKDVRNREAEQRLRARLACSCSRSRDFLLMPQDAGEMAEVLERLQPDRSVMSA